jgi:hypothetical protein
MYFIFYSTFISIYMPQSIQSKSISIKLNSAILSGHHPDPVLAQATRVLGHQPGWSIACLGVVQLSGRGWPKWLQDLKMRCVHCLHPANQTQTRTSPSFELLNING